MELEKKRLKAGSGAVMGVGSAAAAAADGADGGERVAEERGGGSAAADGAAAAGGGSALGGGDTAGGANGGVADGLSGGEMGAKEIEVLNAVLGAYEGRPATQGPEAGQMKSAILKAMIAVERETTHVRAPSHRPPVEDDETAAVATATEVRAARRPSLAPLHSPSLCSLIDHTSTSHTPPITLAPLYRHLNRHTSSTVTPPLPPHCLYRPKSSPSYSVCR